MKYLITKQNQVKVFADDVSHSTMAKKSNIKSAGYFKIAPSGSGIKTYGKSHSTGIKSEKGDDAKVTKHLYKLSRQVR